MQTVETNLEAVMAEKITIVFLGLITKKGSSMSRSLRPGDLMVEGWNFMGRVVGRGVEVFSKQLIGMEVAFSGLVKVMT